MQMLPGESDVLPMNPMPHTRGIGATLHKYLLSTYDVEALEAVCRELPLSKLLMRYEKECNSDVPLRFFLQGNYGYLLDSTEVEAAEAFAADGNALGQIFFNAPTVLSPEIPDLTENSIP